MLLRPLRIRGRRSSWQSRNSSGRPVRCSRVAAQLFRSPGTEPRVQSRCRVRHAQRQHLRSRRGSRKILAASCSHELFTVMGVAPAIGQGLPRTTGAWCAANRRDRARLVATPIRRRCGDPGARAASRQCPNGHRRRHAARIRLSGSRHGPVGAASSVTHATAEPGYPRCRLSRVPNTLGGRAAAAVFRWTPHGRRPCVSETRSPASIPTPITV